MQKANNFVILCNICGAQILRGPAILSKDGFSHEKCANEDLSAMLKRLEKKLGEFDYVKTNS